MTIVLTLCETSDSSDNFSYDFSLAKIADFNGFWEGRIAKKNCSGIIRKI